MTSIDSSIMKRRLYPRIADVFSMTTDGDSKDSFNDLFSEMYYVFGNPHAAIEFVVTWVLLYGEDRHVKNLYSFTRVAPLYDQSEKLFKCLANMEPTQRCRDTHQRLVSMSLRTQSFEFLPLRDISRSIMKAHCLSEEIRHSWVVATLDCNAGRRIESVLRLLLYVWGGAAYRNLEKLFRDGRIDRTGYSLNMLSLGAICMLRNDAPACSRFWARYLDIGGDGFLESVLDGEEHHIEQLSSVDAMEALERSGNFTMLQAAVDTFKVLCIFPIIYDSSDLPEHAVKTARIIEKPVEKRITLLASILSLWERNPDGEEASPLNVNRLLRLVQWTIGGEQRNSAGIADLSHHNVIELMGLLEYHLRGRSSRSVCPTLWSKVVTTLDNKISLADLLKTTQINELEVLLSWYMRLRRFASFRNEHTVDKVRLLLSRGACIGPWSTANNDHTRLWRIVDEALNAFNKYPLVREMAVSRCWCSHPMGCHENVPKLRCLAAARAAEQPLAPLPGQDEPLMSVASGHVRVPLATFIGAHANYSHNRNWSVHVSKRLTAV